MSGIQGDIDSAKSTFSSWDGCMSKAYCKWPVVVAIIIGSLILLSILFCIFRCLCCGVDCCFGCFRCCNACCPSPRRSPDRRSEYAVPSQQPGNFSYPGVSPYQPQAPMFYGSPGVPPGSAKPQFATFETSSPHNATNLQSRKPDALPPMPSWDDAETHHVEEPEPRPVGAYNPQHDDMLDNEKEGDIAMRPIPSTSNTRLHAARDEQLEPMLKEDRYFARTENLQHNYVRTGAGNPYSEQTTYPRRDLNYMKQQERMQNDPNDSYTSANNEFGPSYGERAQPRPPPPIETNPYQNSFPNFNASTPLSYETQPTVAPSHTRIPSASDHAPKISPFSPVPTSSASIQYHHPQQQPLSHSPSAPTVAAAARLNSGLKPQRSPTAYSASNYTYIDDSSTEYEPPNTRSYRSQYSHSPPLRQQESPGLQLRPINGNFSPRPRTKTPSELFYSSNETYAASQR